NLLLAWLATSYVVEERFPVLCELLALDELVTRGYVRGLLGRLDALERQDSAYAGFVEQMRGMAGGFRFDAMRALIREKLEHVD
ncbi:MAG: hypothetical protein G3I10_08575, partial [Ferrovum sp.]|nr:hypothetical protein [Ferrovum sp.]